jgi:TRAP-type C4-dicarboxylate transport system permease small subunit
MILQRCKRLLSQIEFGAAVIAGICMLATMTIVSCDVVMRYVFNSPIGWSYDLISHYLMVGLFTLGVSWTLGYDEHIRILFLHPHLPPRLTAMFDGFSFAACSVLVTAIAYIYIGRTYYEWATDARFIGTFLWPTWITSFLVVIGFGVLDLRLILLSVEGFCRASRSPQATKEMEDA